MDRWTEQQLRERRDGPCSHARRFAAETEWLANHCATGVPYEPDRTMEAKHTPTPWKWTTRKFFGNEYRRGVENDCGEWVFSAEEDVQSESQRQLYIDISDSDAEHIVRCVNSHDRLVKACKIADESLCRATFPGPRDQSDLNYAIKCIRAALAEAEGTGK